MRYGEVYHVHRERFAVLSSDVHNERAGAWPLCAPIVRAHDDEPDEPFGVDLSEADQVTGRLLVDQLAPFLPPETVPPPDATLTGATLAQVKRALRDLFEL